MSEIIYCYYRYYHKKRIIQVGRKPDFIPTNKIITNKEWQSQLNKTEWKNPILEGYLYSQFLEDYPGTTYRDLANKFEISAARICQMIALVKKLPKDIIDYFLNEDNSENFGNFNERRLRPLTLMKCDIDKIKEFKKMKEKLTS